MSMCALVIGKLNYQVGISPSVRSSHQPSVTAIVIDLFLGTFLAQINPVNDIMYA